VDDVPWAQALANCENLTYAGLYWSSTSYAADSNRAHTIDFNNGRINALFDGTKTAAGFVRCVR